MLCGTEMKHLTKHIFALLLSVLFIWIGSGGSYVIFHCFSCQIERIEHHSHGCCDEGSYSCSSVTNVHCYEENDLNAHSNPFAKDLNSNHTHRDGHCVYVIEYKIDIPNSVSEISIPSIDLFQSDLFSLFISPKNETKSDYYTSFVLPRRSTNTLLSALCVFLI